MKHVETYKLEKPNHQNPYKEQTVYKNWKTTEPVNLDLSKFSRLTCYM